MPDVLIRDIPEHVLAAIDAKAQKLGLSRAEYLRRTLIRERQAGLATVSAEDLSVFASTFSDLLDPEVIDRAWR